MSDEPMQSILALFRRGSVTVRAGGSPGGKPERASHRSPLKKEPAITSQFAQVLALMRTGQRMFRQSITEEAEPKGLFAFLKKRPDKLILAAMVEGYDAVIGRMDLWKDEANAAEFLTTSIESFETSAQEFAGTVTESAPVGMARGAVWALGDFHRAMKVVHGPGCALSNGYEKLLKEILRRYQLPI
jgi:hypothetical protein